MPREMATREWRPYRRRSHIEVLGMPLWHIAMGPDPGRDESRGHARGMVAAPAAVGQPDQAAGGTRALDARRGSTIDSRMD